MFKPKRLILPLVALFALAGCGNKTDETRIRLQVWGPADEKELYEKHAAEFQELHPDVKIIVDFGNVGEPEAAENVLSDVATAADVFLYPDDQIAQMANKGVLAALPEGYVNKVKARDLPSAIDAATYDADGKMYGFPISADNGYFLVYNNEYFTETDVLTLEGILAKVSKEHQFVVDMGNGYYATSFIQYISDISYDPITELHETNFNDKKSLDALQGVSDLLKPLKDNGFVSKDFNDDALSELGMLENEKVIAGVTGHWNSEVISEILGDKFSATKLPTFTSADGSTVQWGSFSGSKLVGVKSSSKNLSYALAFADYITEKDAQISRYEAKGWGPSNIEALEAPGISDNVGLAALAAQAPYSIPQGKSVGGLFWNNAAAIGNFMLDGPASESSPQTLQAVLDGFVSVLTQ